MLYSFCHSIGELVCTYKKFIEFVLKRKDLNEFVTKYIENAEKDDADLAIFATALSQMINKCKEAEKEEKLQQKQLELQEKIKIAAATKRLRKPKSESVSSVRQASEKAE